MAHAGPVATASFSSSSVAIRPRPSSESTSAASSSAAWRLALARSLGKVTGSGGYDVSDAAIFIGAAAGGEHSQQLELSRANRHGLIAGATGTGKTVTLQGIVEAFSAAGVPTFVADVKGDLAGLGMAGSATSKTHEVFAARAQEIGYAGWQYRECP